MGTKSAKILTVNAGSSSLKLVLFFVQPNSSVYERLFEITILDIGLPMAKISYGKPGDQLQQEMRVIADQSAATEILMSLLTNNTDTSDISAVGHRIVHGGPKYSVPVLITDEVQSQLRLFAHFDPEHAPAALQLIKDLRVLLHHIPHVACFDTGFFHDLPHIAQIVAIPRKYESLGVRRYGFHGLSYSYLLSAFADMAGEQAAHGRVIFAHLGSGVSLAALKDGKPVDTTMGFSPTAGVVMSSRSGDMDPSVASFLHEQTGMGFEQYNHMVNFESGLLGVSELSGDMYTLLQNSDTNPQAAEAVELFCYQVKKAIGALASTIGGLDSLVFTGGIGERSPPIRARICDGLEFLGITIDDDANQHHGPLISAGTSAVGVHMIRTDEASTIAKQVYHINNEIEDKEEISQ